MDLGMYLNQFTNLDFLNFFKPKFFDLRKFWKLVNLLFLETQGKATLKAAKRSPRRALAPRTWPHPPEGGRAAHAPPPDCLMLPLKASKWQPWRPKNVRLAGS